MIYLDNAAGSHPKAPGVEAAMIEAMRSWGANPGRGSYAFARRTGDMVEQVRGKLAALIHAPDPHRIAFTSGATMSLNALVLGYAPRLAGGEVIVSSLEHNALLRPLYLLEEQGLLRIRMITADAWGYIESAQVAEAVNSQTRLIALSMASNVCGSVQPVAEVGALARRAGLPLLIDASQSAGCLPVDADAWGVDALIFITNRFCAQGEAPDAFKRRLDYLLERLDPALPLGFYECPMPYKRLLSLEELKYAAFTGRFRFMKDTCCDIATIRDRLDVLRGSKMALYNANTATLLESLRAGAAGYSGVMASFHPELYAYLLKNYAAEPQKCEKLQALLTVCAFIEKQYYPVNAKYHLSALKGLDMTINSRTLNPLGMSELYKDEVRQMDALVEAFKQAEGIQ